MSRKRFFHVHHGRYSNEVLSSGYGRIVYPWLSCSLTDSVLHLKWLHRDTNDNTWHGLSKTEKNSMIPASIANLKYYREKPQLSNKEKERSNKTRLEKNLISMRTIQGTPRIVLKPQVLLAASDSFSFELPQCVGFQVCWTHPQSYGEVPLYQFTQ